MEQKLITKTLKIDGMTCVNCQNKIERELKNTKGIVGAKVNYSKGIAIVTFDASVIHLAGIEKVIEKLDYQVIKQGQLSNNITNNKSNNLQIVGVVFIILALYMIISRFGGFSIFNSFPEAKEGMGYGVLFVIGLLTSIHCVAMCGGINLSQCVPNQLTNLEKGSKISKLRPSLLYYTANNRVRNYSSCVI